MSVKLKQFFLISKKAEKTTLKLKLNGKRLCTTNSVNILALKLMRI